MRTIFVGDPHGCLQELLELVANVGYVPGEDELVILGDFLDRGPYPIEVVEACMRIGAKPVKGNHDEKAIRFLRHEAKVAANPAYVNPMIVDPEVEATKLTADPTYIPRRVIPAERIEQWKALSAEQIAWIDTAPAILNLKNGWLAVHAGLEPGKPLKKQKADRMMRVRYVDAKGEMVSFEEGKLEQPPNTVYWTEQWQGPWNVVYGHAVHSRVDPRIDLFEGPTRTVRMVGLDTGCCFGGRLTAMVLDAAGELEFFAHVQAKAAYAKWPDGLMGISSE